jgi:hypothetical protein
MMAQETVTGIHHQVLVPFNQLFERLGAAGFDFVNQLSVIHQRHKKEKLSLGLDNFYDKNLRVKTKPELRQFFYGAKPAFTG